MHKLLIKLSICALALCFTVTHAYADTCNIKGEDVELPVTKEESFRQKLSITRRLSVTTGKYMALAFNRVSQRGIKFIGCQFFDRNGLSLADTSNLAECFVEKLYHDLNYQNDGQLRLLISNDQGQQSWTNVKWAHAKLKTKTDQTGFRGFAQKFKRNRWVHAYKNALNHKIEIDLEAPIDFTLQQVSFNVLKGVTKVEIDLYVEKESEHLIGSLKLTDELGVITGVMKSDFSIAGQIKNELIYRNCLPSKFKHNEFKFVNIINREEVRDTSFDQLPPIVIQERD